MNKSIQEKPIYRLDERRVSWEPREPILGKEIKDDQIWYRLSDLVLIHEDFVVRDLSPYQIGQVVDIECLKCQGRSISWSVNYCEKCSNDGKHPTIIKSIELKQQKDLLGTIPEYGRIALGKLVPPYEEYMGRWLFVGVV